MKVWAVVLGGVRYDGRPLSAEAVRQFYATASDPAKSDAALERLLRRMFPLAWRMVWAGDPVRKWMKDAGRYRRLSVLTAIPKRVRPPKPQDEWDRLAAMNRDPVPPEPGPQVTLDAICRLTEAVMGAGWYFNRDRWDTWDGYAPLDVVYAAWDTLDMLDARHRLDMVRAVMTTKAERPEQIINADIRESIGG